MKSAETLLRYLLGPARTSLLPIVLAVERTRQLLFIESRKIDNISVMRDVYAVVAAQTD